MIKKIFSAIILFCRLLFSSAYIFVYLVSFVLSAFLARLYRNDVAQVGGIERTFMLGFIYRLSRCHL